MRYLKDTLYYLFAEEKGKPALAFFLFTLLPSAFLMYAVPIEKIFRNIIFPESYANWGQLWISYSRSPRSLIALIPGVLLSVIATACICSTLIRNFRIGDFRLPNIFRSLNDYFFPALIYSAANTALFFFSFTLYSFFAFMWHLYMTRIAYSVLTGIAFLLIAAGVIYIVGSLTLWFPSMAVRGIYKRKALSTAFYQSRGKQKYFFAGYLFTSIIFIVTAAVASLATKIWYISFIVSTVGCALAYAFSVTYITVTYFAENKLPREDLEKSPYKRS